MSHDVPPELLTVEVLTAHRDQWQREAHRAIELLNRIRDGMRDLLELELPTEGQK